MLAVAAALVGERIAGERDVARHERLVTAMAGQLAEGGVRAKVFGAMIALGQINAAIRETAAGRRPPDNAETIEVLRALDHAFDLGNAFVTNRDGVVVAYHVDSGVSGSGRNLIFRPYIRAALSGTPAMYAAMGTATGDRGIYVAAPIPQRRTAPGAIEGEPIGAVVAKVSFDEIDELLDAAPIPVALVSPEGVVFASNQLSWRFRIVGANVDAAAVAKDPRAGRAYDLIQPQRLDIAVDGTLELDGQRHRMVALDVDWHDPQGNWRLLGFANAGASYGWPGRAIVGLTTFLLVLLALQWRAAHRAAHGRTGNRQPQAGRIVRHRSADRARQPPALRRGAGDRDAAGKARRQADGAGDDRRRPLQEIQRPLWPPGR